MKSWLLIGLVTAVACDAGSLDTPGADATPSGGGADAAPGDQPDAETAQPFSFFVTSLDAMRELSGSQDGFGGNLGGLDGADSICQQAAARVGAGDKTWRAFLSATTGPGGAAVHARDRIGTGPWYDANGRLVASDLTGLLQERPDGDPATVSDLPNELGEPLTIFGDSHDILTGSNEQGMLDDADPVATCQDWTSAVGPGSENRVRLGHSWPAQSGTNWIRAHRARGCAPGVNLTQNGPGVGDTVGAGGGWGGIYCFALEP